MRNAVPGRAQPNRGELTLILQALPYCPGRVDMAPDYYATDSRKLLNTRLYPLMNSQFKIPIWHVPRGPAGQVVESQSFQDIRAALKVISGGGLIKNPLSVRERKSNFIFQRFAADTIKNLNTTADFVLQQARSVDLPDSKQFAIIMGRMHALMKYAIASSTNTVKRKIRIEFYPVVGDADDVFSATNFARVAWIKRLPVSMSRAKGSSNYEEYPFLSLEVVRDNLKALHSEWKSMMTSIQWFNDLDPQEAEKTDQVFMEQLARLIEDVDKFANLTHVDLDALRNAETGKDMFGQYGARRPPPSPQKSQIPSSELGKLHSLIDSKEDVKKLEDSWLQFFLLLRKKPGDLKLKNFDLQQDEGAMRDVLALSEFADLSGLIGMEAASMSGYAQLRTWLSILTKPQPILKHMIHSVDSGPASEFRDIPSIYKYYSDRVLASFCSNLTPAYAGVIIDMFKNCKYVDIDVFRQCYESPAAWLRGREYLFIRNDKDYQAQFGSVIAEPLWKLVKGQQRAAMRQLDPSKRADIVAREKELAGGS